MTAKVIAPAALNALKVALGKVYWYKDELRSFVTQCVHEPRILSQLDWNSSKRNIASTLVDYLAADQAKYQSDLLRLMTEVARISDFSHLEKLDNGGEPKADAARAAVEAVRKQISAHDELMVDRPRREDAQKAASDNHMRSERKHAMLDALKSEVQQLIGSPGEPQRRGYRLEKIVNELFELFGLAPSAPFKIQGEQLDGAFTFEGTDFLFEGKWQNQLVRAADLDVFASKLTRKLANTLGLFLSMNGFSVDGVAAFSTGHKTVLLMDGCDLMAVLEERIDLRDLIRRKKRHAAQTGDIYLQIHGALQR